LVIRTKRYRPHLHQSVSRHQGQAQRREYPSCLETIAPSRTHHEYSLIPIQSTLHWHIRGVGGASGVPSSKLVNVIHTVLYPDRTIIIKKIHAPGHVELGQQPPSWRRMAWRLASACEALLFHASDRVHDKDVVFCLLRKPSFVGHCCGFSHSKCSSLIMCLRHLPIGIGRGHDILVRSQCV